MTPSGRLRLLGRLADSSNATFLAVDDDETNWVYKPLAGERPLHDFPDGTLGRREVAAYALSEELGLGVVPPTLWHDGPLGEGSLQRWIDGGSCDLIDLLDPRDITERWLPVLTAPTSTGGAVVLAHRDDQRLRRLALFDAVINNADRKASHVIAHGERLLGVDHGLSLHAEPKLRTVLWGFSRIAFTEDERSLLSRVRCLSAPLAPGLSDEEWQALVTRAERLLSTGVFPAPVGTWRDIPWPPL